MGMIGECWHDFQEYKPYGDVFCSKCKSWKRNEAIFKGNTQEVLDALFEAIGDEEV
jgi:hypothetical protein